MGKLRENKTAVLFLPLDDVQAAEPPYVYAVYNEADVDAYKEDSLLFESDDFKEVVDYLNPICILSEAVKAV